MIFCMESLESNPEKEVKNSFNLKVVLQQPVTDYRKLIEESRKDFSGWRREEVFADYGEFLLKLREGEDLVLELGGKLKDTVLLDIGGGNGKLYYFANRFQAKTYLNVDKYADGIDGKKPLDPEADIHTEATGDGGKLSEFLPPRNTQEVTVKADMLDFVSRLPDDSVNVTVNGIDEDIVPNPAYHQALACEILRIVKKDGFIVGHGSRCLFLIYMAIRNLEIHGASIQEGDETEIQKRLDGIFMPKVKMDPGYYLFEKQA